MLYCVSGIDITKSPYLQDPMGATNPIAFSSSSYWSGKQYIYPGNSNVSQYINSYRGALEKMGINVIDAKLLSYEQAIDLGCITYVPYCYVTGLSWLYSSAYWLGSSYNMYDVF